MLYKKIKAQLLPLLPFDWTSAIGGVTIFAFVSADAASVRCHGWFSTPFLSSSSIINQFWLRSPAISILVLHQPTVR
ncbi:MAG: hypothetical protein CMJ78_06970 [Planctomycetaceae bacterium]|nr:hypothetical protein [Planctomycetaceae bacterium]